MIEAAKREVMEETGLKIDIEMLIDTQYFSKGDKDYVAFVFQGRLNEENKEANELDYDFFDIKFVKNNRNLLRNDKLILSAIEKASKGSKSAVCVLR